MHRPDNTSNNPNHREVGQGARCARQGCTHRACCPSFVDTALDVDAGADDDAGFEGGAAAESDLAFFLA